MYVVFFCLGISAFKNHFGLFWLPLPINRGKHEHRTLDLYIVASAGRICIRLFHLSRRVSARRTDNRVAATTSTYKLVYLRIARSCVCMCVCRPDAHVYSRRCVEKSAWTLTIQSMSARINGFYAELSQMNISNGRSANAHDGR